MFFRKGRIVKLKGRGRFSLRMQNRLRRRAIISLAIRVESFARCPPCESRYLNWTTGVNFITKFHLLGRVNARKLMACAIPSEPKLHRPVYIRKPLRKCVYACMTTPSNETRCSIHYQLTRILIFFTQCLIFSG